LGQSHKFSDTYVQKRVKIQASECHTAPSEHNMLFQANNCCATVQHSLACAAPFLWGPASAKHTENA